MQEPREAHLGSGTMNLRLQVLRLLLEITLARIIADKLYLLLAVLARQLHQRVLYQVLKPQLRLGSLGLGNALIYMLLPGQVLLVARRLSCHLILNRGKLSWPEARSVYIDNRLQLRRRSRSRWYLLLLFGLESFI
jgi:hypothetical protein